MHTEHIGKRLGNVSNHLRRYIDNRISEYGVTHMQSMIICFLVHRGDEPVYQKDIEREFGIRRSSVTTILQLMEKNGLISIDRGKIIVDKNNLDKLSERYGSIVL